MASSSYSSRSVDVQVALQKAKKKICDLQQQLEEKSLEDPNVISSPSWTSKKELGDSLVDMYRVNPKVNEELRQRLPLPSRHHLSNTNRWCTTLTICTPSFLPELPVCCCSPGPDRSPAWRTASPVSPPSIRSSSAALSSSLPGGRGEMEADILQSADPFPWAESSENCLDEEAALRGPKSPVLERNLEPPGNSSPQISASSPRQTVGPTRNISFLLKELDAMRELNNKVLEEMLAAQKDRDQALMSRLLLANEERDEALLRARRLQEAAGSDDITLQDVDMDIKDLLQHVCKADSVQEVRQFGSALVQRVRLAQQRRSDITAQEMKAVMEERDKSVDKHALRQVVGSEAPPLIFFQMKKKKESDQEPSSVSLLDVVIQTRTACSFPNDKTCITLKELLNLKKQAFKEGDQEKLRPLASISSLIGLMERPQSFLSEPVTLTTLLLAEAFIPVYCWPTTTLIQQLTHPSHLIILLLCFSKEALPLVVTVVMTAGCAAVKYVSNAAIILREEEERALHVGGSHPSPSLSTPCCSPIPHSLLSSLRDYLPQQLGVLGSIRKRGRVLPEHSNPHASWSFLLLIELISGNYRLSELIKPHLELLTTSLPVKIPKKKPAGLMPTQLP
ncbi:hypothetical protein CCH79_00007766 [Gambusia affinis]|uniref:Uncharacterized protein n=1 Tax=Gambusia affinis TaxID=33528 RepID=A0A315W1Y3_GAMAF|nr:hypothetical protein CCH79_00007766 [Gambusia affinis]